MKQLTERAYIAFLFFLILPLDEAEPSLGQCNWEAVETDVLIWVL